MQTTYLINADELDDRFLNALKMLFAGKQIEILVTEMDETAYLLRSKANRERLMAAIINVENGHNIVDWQP
jgi:antitoxin YefM